LAVLVIHADRCISSIDDREVYYMLDQSYNDIWIYGLCQARISRQATKGHNSLNNKVVILIAERFRVLGDPLRLQLLHLLDDSEMSVGALVEATGAGERRHEAHAPSDVACAVSVEAPRRATWT
jgi:hypothetical protein